MIAFEGHITSIEYEDDGMIRAIIAHDPRGIPCRIEIDRPPERMITPIYGQTSLMLTHQTMQPPIRVHL
jgi:hypothetical protein